MDRGLVLARLAEELPFADAGEAVLGEGCGGAFGGLAEYLWPPGRMGQYCVAYRSSVVHCAVRMGVYKRRTGNTSGIPPRTALDPSVELVVSNWLYS